MTIQTSERIHKGYGIITAVYDGPSAWVLPVKQARPTEAPYPFDTLERLLIQAATRTASKQVRKAEPYGFDQLEQLLIQAAKETTK